MPIIQIKHLLSLPDSERERRSIQSIKPLEQAGFVYCQNINPPYPNGELPLNCVRPQEVSATPKPNSLGPGHYGAYLAHKEAIKQVNWNSIDALLIFECDAALTCSIKKFCYMVQQALLAAEKFDVGYMSLGNHPIDLKFGEKLGRYFARAQIQYWTHCYLIFPKWAPAVIGAFETSPWDTIDLWYNQFIQHVPRSISLVPWCLQGSGYSLIDGHYKDKTANPMPRGKGRGCFWRRRYQ